MCILLRPQGFFRPRVPVDNLEGFTVGVTYFGDMDDLVSPTVVSPDAGGVYRCVRAAVVAAVVCCLLWLLFVVATHLHRNSVGCVGDLGKVKQLRHLFASQRDCISLWLNLTIPHILSPTLHNTTEPSSSATCWRASTAWTAAWQ
jgi:hypothetical protein